MADTQAQANHDRQVPTIDTGAPVPVALEYVEAQLHELWRDVAEAAQVKGGVQAVTMAQVLNLIVHAPSRVSANQYVRDIDLITGRHPCRVILTLFESEEMPVQAWVSIHCQLPPAGGRQVCCEQVSVAAGGEVIRQVPAAIIPLLIPELPVFLWWPEGSPFDDYLFRNLTDTLNRLIVDSATFENPEGTLAKMAVQLRSNWPNLAATDMNWGRLTRWRELVAQFFDGAAMRPYLDRIGNEAIDFALGERGQVNRAQALMVAGWLASRLGWQPVEPVYELARSDSDRPAAVRLSLRAGKRPVRVTLNAVPHNQDVGVPGDILAILLEVPGGAEGQVEARFQVGLIDEPDKCALTNVQIEGVNPTTRQIQLDSYSRAELLDIELEVFSRDKVYEEALAMVGVFIRGTTRKETEGTRKIGTGEPISAAQVPKTRPQATPNREQQEPPVEAEQ